jgi:hypothetical protein
VGTFEKNALPFGASRETSSKLSLSVIRRAFVLNWTSTLILSFATAYLSDENQSKL